MSADTCTRSYSNEVPDLDVSAKPRLTAVIGAVRRWPMRRWVAAGTGGLASALVVGIPTGVVPTSLYTRMTPVQWWNYPVLAATVVLAGLAIATYVRPAPGNSPHRMGGMTGGGLLSAFAIGCPICNKLVVAALGVSGALDIWAPIQPFLGLSALALLGFALIHRLRGEVSCSVPIP